MIFFVRKCVRGIWRKLMGESDKVHVRIVLAVDQSGQWYARGSDSRGADEERVELSNSFYDWDTVQMYYVDLEVPKARVPVIHLPSPERQQIHVHGIVKEVS